MVYWLRNKSYFWRERITLDKVPKDKRNERFWVISNYDNSPVQYICTLTRARRIIVFCWVGHLIFLLFFLLLFLLIITVIITIINNSRYYIYSTLSFTILYCCYFQGVCNPLLLSLALPHKDQAQLRLWLRTGCFSLQSSHLSPLLVVLGFVRNFASGVIRRVICHKHHDQRSCKSFWALGQIVKD